jgi:membrane protein DedA with SNARE-associated domain
MSEHDRSSARRGARLAAGIALGVLGWAPSALACPGCLSGDEDTRIAYYGTTLLLIAVPVLVLGVIIGWLRRAARRSEARTEASGPSKLPSSW